MDFHRRSSTVEIIDSIFNWHKIRYQKMEALFGQVEIQEAIERVNVYINIESIIGRFHNPEVDNFISTMDANDVRRFHNSIVANTFNLAAHYRWFFAKNHIASNIVFFMNRYDKYSSQNNAMTNKEYRHKYIYNYTENPKLVLINEVIRSALNTIDKIVDYVENVYFLSSGKVESSLIPYILDKNKSLNGQLNIIITRDQYDLQYVNKKFIVLYPYGEESAVISRNNLYNVWKRPDDEKKYYLPTYLFPFVLSVVGDNHRSLKNVPGIRWKSLYKILKHLFEEMDITEEEIISFEQLAGAIKEDPEAPVSNRELVVNNYLCIDLDRQYAMVSPTQISELESQLIDRFEGDALKKLNDGYFRETPINIVELNQYSSKRSRKKLF